ncbi:MAG: tRNA dihydrouridine synthase DusB [Proteobacteria bacterium]|nr:tRNA dihydrouridine synthase DusB [Pseudomonadota bacterium]
MSLMKIGPYILTSPVIAAPMAGVTDQPFRSLCRRLGAALTVSEMVTSDTKLWCSQKTQFRLDHRGEEAPRTVQIAGIDPLKMAEAAKMNVDLGAEIIDINMGCPAKKVCKAAAGSALLRDEPLVALILRSVVREVKVPVTLKIRTGWDQDSKNATRIAKIAEDCGIQALAIHGRTRNDFFNGAAEYETIAAVKASVGIPIIANGDVDSPEKALHVLKVTGADAVMIGRAAQGRPWIFREITHYLKTMEHLPPPTIHETKNILLEHLVALYDFYGEPRAVRLARKHVGWYLGNLPAANTFRTTFNMLESGKAQTDAIIQFMNPIEKQQAPIIESLAA